MKKIIALCLAICVVVCSFVSCGDEPGPVETTAETKDTSYRVTDNVLENCIGLADENGVYVVPDDITVIGESAFAGDTTLKEIVIGENVKLIGAGAFQNCTSLRKVTMAEGVEALGSHAFYGCSSLEEIILPSTIKRLEAYVFYGCQALESISLENITYIDNAALWYCSSLTDVTFCDDLEYIGDWAFAQCQSLPVMDLSACEKLTAIGDYAYAACSALRTVNLPNSLEKIGKLVFYACSRLYNIEIPTSLRDIDFGAFNYTPWYQEQDEDYIIVGDGVLIKCNVTPQALDLSGKGIKHLAGSVFWNAEFSGSAADYGYKYAWELENVVIPEGVETIGTSAFAGCMYLKNVTLPSTLVRIEDNAFNVYSEMDTNEVNVDLTACASLTHIGHYAFFGCAGLKEIVLADSVNYVGEYAFAMTGAQDAFYLSCEASKENQFLVTGDGVLIFAYVADDQKELVIPEGVRVIGGASLSGWDTAVVPDSTDQFSLSGKSKYNLSYTVTSVKLPSTLETICASAFYRVSGITSLVLPDSLELVDSYAFAFCESLSSISGGNNLREIGDYAFYYCAALPAFRFSSNTEVIGNNVFNGCVAMKTVYFPEGATLGESIFSEGCESLTTVYIAPEERVRIYAVVGAITQGLNIMYYED